MALDLGRSSEVAEVEAPRLGRGSFGGSGAGVAHQHVGAGPSGDGHEAGFGAPGGEPAVGGGVAEPVRPEALDSGALGSPAQRAAEPLAAELLATIAEPQVWGVGKGVLRALVEVCQQRLGGGLADRDGPALSRGGW